MSEYLSSDEEWSLSTLRHLDNNAHPDAKCWECGKKFSKITTLMSHYKSHNIKATCHICKVTFRRLTSLSTHLDNVHSPPLCKKCLQTFNNVWELNAHVETHCLGSPSFEEAPSLRSAVMRQSPNSHAVSNEVTAQQSTNPILCDPLSELRSPQRTEMKPGRSETSENSVEYIVGEDDNDFDLESDCDKADDSTSSESDDEDKTHSKPDDPESDGGSNSSSTDCSSDSSNSPNSKKTPAILPSTNSSICASCGRGPFRSIKLHLLHCSGIRVKYQCSLCKELFVSESSLNEHYMPLYSCDICGQVFSHENAYHHHQCPKGNRSPLVLFCSESMPQACNICKSFFTSEKTLLNHVTRVHSSVVSTKVCIITNPSALTDKKVSPGLRGTTAAQSNVNQVINGKLHIGQNYAGSLSTVVKSSPSSLSTSSSHPGRPPAVNCMPSSAAAVRSGKDGAPDQSNNQPLNHLPPPLFVRPNAGDAGPDTATPDSASAPTILALFENGSHNVALMKRMNTGWRSKAPFPCRQCGAILRQPSLIISHRYLHRGHRSHQCQCGRAFKHQLHLLRHCVQHAETVSYICVSCGDTFTGAKLLAEHMRGKSRKETRSGRTWKHTVKRNCRMPFACDCGQLFFRPSAYIWHQLKNRTKTKQLKKSLK